MSCSAVLDCQLAFAATAAAASLPDLCLIERPVLTDDNQGGRTRAYSTIASNVGCLVSQSQRQAVEQNRADKMTGKTQWNIALPRGQDVKATDRIVVTTLANRTFEVSGPLTASVEVLREVQAVEIL